jgi:hypothetical protein
MDNSMPDAIHCGNCGAKLAATGGYNGQPANSQPQYQQQNQPNQAQYQPPPQAPYRPPKKTGTGVKVGIAVAVLVVGALLAYAVILPALNTTSNSNLSPARSLAGTWTTTAPTQFNIKTDFNTPSLEYVGYQTRNVTFVITTTSDPNVVNVAMSFSINNTNLISESGYTPDVSPNYYTGAINGTQLQMRSGSTVIGVFSFTTSTMTGTWDDNWTMVWSQEVYTSTNAIKLYKQ